MAKYQETLQKLLNKEEVIFWGSRNGVEVEEVPGGLFVGEWKINLDDNDYIVSVERRLDEPRGL